MENLLGRTGANLPTFKVCAQKEKSSRAGKGVLVVLAMWFDTQVAASGRMKCSFSVWPELWTIAGWREALATLRLQFNSVAYKCLTTWRS